MPPILNPSPAFPVEVVFKKVRKILWINDFGFEISSGVFRVEFVFGGFD